MQPNVIWQRTKSNGLNTCQQFSYGLPQFSVNISQNVHEGYIDYSVFSYLKGMEIWRKSLTNSLKKE